MSREDAIQSIIASTGGKCWEDPGAVQAMRIAYDAGRKSVLPCNGDPCTCAIPCPVEPA